MTVAAREQRDATLVRLYCEEGWSSPQVAAHLRLSATTVATRLKALGKLRPRVPAWCGPVPESMRACIPRALTLAEITLERVAPPHTPEYAREDWQSICCTAALLALGTYRPEQAAHWSSWVIAKVRWAIAEELRRTAPLGRGEWARRKTAEREQLRLAGATDAEIQTRLEQLAGELFAAARIPNRTWERTWDDPEGISREPSWEPDPLDWLQARAVRDAVNRLPERLRQIISWQQQGYLEVEIGARLGISKGRVRQLLEDVRAQLREALGEWVEAP